MRILVVLPDFGARGTQRVAQNYALAYREAGHEVYVLPFSDEGPRRAAFIAAGARIVTRTAGGHERLAQAAARGFDFMHIHRAGVAVRRETELLRTLRDSVGAVLETNVFSRFDPEVDGLIDVHGQLTRAGQYRFLSTSRGRTHGAPVVLPNAVCFDAFGTVTPSARVERSQRLRVELGIPAEALVFGRIGKTDRRWLGRLPALLRALPQAVVASVRDAELDAPLARLAADHPGRIFLLAQTLDDERLGAYYSLFDLLLHWSENGESFGMVLVEAIAQGAPVIMPLQPHRDLGGVEVVGHREGGLIAGSAGHLVETAIRAAGDLEGLGQRLVHAQERHRTGFDHRALGMRAVRLAEVAARARKYGRSVWTAVEEELGEATTIPAAFMRHLLRAVDGPRSKAELALHAASHNAVLSRAPQLLRRLRGRSA
jgi:glycosyltransferase involved in cell wall biosynthesis